MPRRSRNRMLGKQVQVEQEERAEALRMLLAELRAAARTGLVPDYVVRPGRRG